MSNSLKTIFIALCLAVGGLFFLFWTQRAELNIFKNTPPKTITKLATSPCPSELVTFLVVTPVGPIVIHIRPGDVDHMIQQKHAMLQEIEKKRAGQGSGNKEPKTRPLNRFDI